MCPHDDSKGKRIFFNDKNPKTKNDPELKVA